jgi:LAO/AO transport system kinase
METAKKIMDGDIRTASRLIRKLEDRRPQAKSTIKYLYPSTGKAHIIGFTGAEGAGKSTLINETIAELRRRGKKVGVIPVDTSSVFSGGALLGDRIRMESHARDPDVFIRSMASRGALGGFCPAIGEAIHVMDAMGNDVIILETVGTGQMGTEVINYAHTVIVVQVPGLGDEIQALKAGILEIADLFVVNRADQEGAGKLYRELMYMIGMIPHYPGGWRPPIVRTENPFDKEAFQRSIAELVDLAEQHYQNIMEHDLLSERLSRRVIMEFSDALESVMLEPVERQLMESGKFDEFVDILIKKESDPMTLVEEFLASHHR